MNYSSITNVEPMVKVHILYWTPRVLATDTILSGFSDEGKRLFVRVETVEVPDNKNALVAAIALANPREDEVVLNTVLAN